jgi:peptidylprolyl isomerase
MKTWSQIGILLIIAGGLFLWHNLYSTKEVSIFSNDKGNMKITATIKTNRGDIVIGLFSDKAPITSENFIKLSNSGFYDGTKFHRIIDGFMVQGGDPNSKGDDTSLYGTGDPGYSIEDEFGEGLSNTKGTISMANAGPNTGGSQFFINLVDNVGLDYDKEPKTSAHPVFGKVVSGMEIVEEIGGIQTDTRDVPLEPVIIKTIEINENS